MSHVRLSSIRFHNFKSLKTYSIAIHETNILAGPNNSGKSTIISALRMLDVALRKAKRTSPTSVRLPNNRYGIGHHIQLYQAEVSLENVSTNYNDEDSWIEFKISNQNTLFLYFPPDGGCTLYWETSTALVNTAAKFKKAFPIEIYVVPVLGPLEHNEALVLEDTVSSSLATHRASRHFRNYWRYRPQGWEDFAALVARTWPGMEICRPELNTSSRTLAMFASEERISREIYWAGFGFQIWCQLLTHISRASNCTLLAIDEPEIYLHPDVQRQLLGILRDVSADILVATHSVEILGEADPAEILLTDKKKQHAQRLKDIEGVQNAITSIGSVQNVTLAHLARTRKILFVEGMDDFRKFRKFAKRLGKEELAAALDVTPFESGGFSSWENVKAYAWGVKRTIDSKFRIFAVYDRDYRCGDEVAEILGKLVAELDGAWILARKEAENYLLNEAVLTRLVEKQCEQRARRAGSHVSIVGSVKKLLEEITDSIRTEVHGQYLAKEIEHKRSTGLDVSTLTSNFVMRFEASWSILDERLAMVPGKQVLRKFREVIQAQAGISATDAQIVQEFRVGEIAQDMIELVKALDDFRAGR